MPLPSAKSMALVSIALLAATLSVCAINLTWNLRLVSQTLRSDFHSSAAEVKRAATRGADFVEMQTRQLQSPAYQKWLAASLQTPAVFNGTGRLINTQFLPRAWRLLDTASRGLETNLELLAENQRRLGLTVEATTRLVNNFTDIAVRFGLTADEMNEAIRQASEKTGMTIDEIYRRISDKRWDELTDRLLQTAAHVEETTGQITVVAENAATASGEMPGIARSLEKIAKTSSKFTRITLVANIISTLARAFVP
ncbi:MAG TPA: hypothetical protein VNN73_17570 [Blastocatellia bacterium]|nr:hypothetical protein [Blastocatellia bacterium]